MTNYSTIIETSNGYIVQDGISFDRLCLATKSLALSNFDGTKFASLSAQRR